ncbi:hypothetical protein C8J57DRAFT_462208 [Mycena rebaudengoi]|nr:hypothetical protein C8J57DRAFT_462208 [Mycena rebaudengoi]
MNMDCEEFAPPNQTGKVVETATTQSTLTGKMNVGLKPTGEVSFMKSKMKAKAVENVNDRITPKCAVHYRQGKSWTGVATHYNSFSYAYEAAKDLTSDEKDTKHPMIAEFSIGINVGDPEHPSSTQLPEMTSYIARNQTNLWIANDLLQSKGQGILVLTSAYIPDIQTETTLYATEYQTVDLWSTSIIDPPATDKTPAKYDAAVAVAIGALINPPDSKPKGRPGFFKTMAEKLSGLSLLRRKEAKGIGLPRIRLHEFIARGWDDTINEWRLPIYPTLDKDFYRASKVSTRGWSLVIANEKGDVPTPPEYRGKRAVLPKRDSGHAPDFRIEIDDSHTVSMVGATLASSAELSVYSGPSGSSVVSTAATSVDLSSTPQSVDFPAAAPSAEKDHRT